MASISGTKNEWGEVEEEEVLKVLKENEPQGSEEEEDKDPPENKTSDEETEGSEASSPDFSVGESMSDGEIPETHFIEEQHEEDLLCYCMEPNNMKSLEYILKFSPSISISTVDCLVSNIERCYNYLLNNDNDEITPYRLMFVDLFYRYRHEILSKSVFHYLNIDQNKTDVPFSNFGIESKRTPDCILKEGDKLFIIEVTVTFSEEKAFQMKGVESAGFESKYKREIDELKLIYKEVSYSVLHFNMNDPDSSSAYCVMEEMDLTIEHSYSKMFIIKALCRNLSRVTKKLKSYNALPSTLLFSPEFDVMKCHPDLEFCYDNKPFHHMVDYREFNISFPIYRKINSLWSRLDRIRLNQLGDDKSKFLFYIDVSNDKVKFYHDKNGINVNQFKEIVDSNNKQKFFELLKLKMGDHLKNASDSSDGVKYVKRVEYVSERGYEEIEYTCPHQPNSVNIDGCIENFQHYEKICNRNKLTSFYPKYYNKNYDYDYMRSIKNFDNINCPSGLSEDYSFNEEIPDTLVAYDNDRFDIDALITSTTDNFKLNNNSELERIPNVIIRMKPSFILPMALVTNYDRCTLDYKNDNLIEYLLKCDIGEYTKCVLSKAMSTDYSFYNKGNVPSENLNNNYKERFKVSNKMTRFVKEKMRHNKNIFDIKALDNEEKDYFEGLKSESKKLTKLISKMEKEENVKKEISMVRVLSKGKSIMAQNFRNEMQHFKQKSFKSSIEGVGLGVLKEGSYESLRMNIKNLQETLTMDCGENRDFLIDMSSHDDVKVLSDLKNYTIESYRDLIHQIKNSALGHSSAFISNYCHSLMYYSQLPFNNSYIRIDNLGFTNVLLIVRGGSKIFKTKNSKMHRLLFPVNYDISLHYVDEGIGTSNYKRLEYAGQYYILTPWIMLNENILVDSISFYPRICAFCTLNLKNDSSFSSQFYKVFLNVILAFHNRRQTEAMLANLRYILLSTMGDYSAFGEIFKEFGGFNYDKVQAYLRLQLITNYKSYYVGMKEIQCMKSPTKHDFSNKGMMNIFTEEVLESTDDLTLMIYSTFLMTKAPYQKSVERASNLRGILKIHKQFDDEVGLNLNSKDQLKKVSVNLGDDYYSYSRKLMSSDFNLDPEYCTNLGIFADSYYKQNVGKEEIMLEWLKICNKNWDSMATTTGLRGYKQENFFGMKGYFVIYDLILNDENYSNAVKDLFNENIDSDTKRKRMRDLNQTYASKMNLIPEKLIYHAVDKRQWRGGREIYVMDLETKRMQQPIEKFMAFLCKKLDTELISIPSDKRSQVIHHSLFERDIPDKDLETWFLTLDCSKWAPKSMFIKFALMILPMLTIPGSFKVHFLNYLNLLYKKRLYFNKSEVDVILNNENDHPDCHGYLVSDSKVNGYYMIQPYSWVMGIFNYTSSLMHAFNQKYCSYILKETTMENFNEECNLMMYAHSDDSGGRLTVSNSKMLSRALYIYEVNLKACNHILSKKKCVISKIYFEILSIIYLFSQLLALLPKFLGGIRFLPTDKGPAQDMLQSYSKCIEVIVAGADFNTAYLYMKFYSADVWRFYNKSAPLRKDYDRPVQYLGMPDAHPLMILLCGSDSDIIRLVSVNKVENIILIYRLMRYFELFNNEEGLIRSLKFIVKIRNTKKKFKSTIEELQSELASWSLGNVNYKNTAFNSLSFLKKLNDPGFIGSLMNETEARRLSRAFYFSSGDCIDSKVGPKTLKGMLDLMREINAIFECEDSVLFESIFGKETLKEFRDEVKTDSDSNQLIVRYFNDIYSDSLKLCKYLNQLTFTKDKLRKVQRTLKPGHIQVIKFGRGFTTNFDPTQLISLIYEPALSWALPNPNNLENAKKDFMNLTEHLKINYKDIDEGTALKIVRSHQNKYMKDIYLYSSIPSFLKMIKNFSGLLTFLATNSFFNYEIQGITLKLKSNITSNSIVDTDIDYNAYRLSTYLDVLTTLSRDINLLNLTYNPLPEINFEGGDFFSLIDSFKEMKFSDNNFMYYSHYLNYLENKFIIFNKVNDGAIFDDCVYHIYIKEQKFRGSWYGRGSIGVYFRGDWLVIELMNNEVLSYEGNIIGKMDRNMSSYINDTLHKAGIESGFSRPLGKVENVRSNLYMGYDFSGEISIENSINLRTGVSYKLNTVQHRFINNVRNTIFKHNKGNVFIGEDPKGMQMKLYTLAIERGEIITFLKTAIKEESISNYLYSEGYNDYADFIEQNILSRYGAEQYITLDDLKKGYNGSLIYELMLDTQFNDAESMPRKVQTSNIPAPRGSLLRMIINYQNRSSEEIINQPKNLNPAILKIRNEFPESFSALLSERMCEDYNKIYDSEEKLMIMTEFDKAVSLEDPNKVRDSCIKLMCYWGYSSLVNVIQTYTFSRSRDNHKIFSLSSTHSENKNIYAELFITFINALFKTMNKNFFKNKPINYPYPFLIPKDIETLRDEFLTETAYCSYNYTSIYLHPLLSHMKVLNVLRGMIKDPEFCIDFIEEVKHKYPLNTLDVSPESIEELTSTLNTLRLIWLRSRKSELKLDYKLRNPHLPHNSVNPVSLIKELGENSIKISPKRVKFNFFLNEEIKSEIEKLDFTFYVNNERYIIQQQYSDFSDTEVPVCSEYRFKNMLDEDFVNSDDGQDVLFEMTSMEPDIETVIDIMKGAESPYKSYETKKRGRSKVVKIHWVICPNVEGFEPLSSKINNIGENVCILTNCYINKINCLRFSSTYKINFSTLGNRVQDMFCHVVSSSKVPTEFWDKFIGSRGRKMGDINECIEYLGVKKIRVGEKSIETSHAGQFIGNEKESDSGEEKRNKDVQAWLKLGFSEVETQELLERKMKIKELNQEIDSELEKLLDKGYIDAEKRKAMKSKYFAALRSKTGNPMTIIDSFLNEVELLNINNFMQSTDSSITTHEQYVKMMQAPEFFGVSHLKNKPDSKAFKDPRYKMELECIHDGLSDLIASGTLSISHRMLKSVKSHYNIWRNAVSVTRYKTDCKKFFLNYFLTIINSASCHHHSKHDDMWMNMVNTFAEVIGEEDEKEDIDMCYRLPPSSGLRLKYRTVAFR